MPQQISAALLLKTGKVLYRKSLSKPGQTAKIYYNVSELVINDERRTMALKFEVWSDFV